MSQRVVVGCVALLMLVVPSSFAATASQCPGAGKATIQINGDPTSKVSQSSVLMTDNTKLTGTAYAAPVDTNTDPYPNGIAIFFSNISDCNGARREFPDQGGVFIGTTKLTDAGASYHMLAGRYCGLSNKSSDPKEPLKPRNVINIVTTANACAAYIGYADIQTLTVLYDAKNIPSVSTFSASFTVHCVDIEKPGPTPATGTITYQASPAPKGNSKPSKVKATLGTTPPCLTGEEGSSGSGGGGTDGGGGGGGTVGTPTNISFVVPENISATAGPIVINPSESNTFEIQTATANGFAGDVVLDAISDAADTDLFDVSVSPQLIASPGSGKATLKITTHPLTFPKDYNVTLIAMTPSDGAVYTYTFAVTVPCDPPKILGTQQPQSATVGGNAKASLKVTPAGSGPFSYQWYTGMPGMTDFPVKDATSATFSTDQDGMYWVRVTNACGTVDSEAATVSH